MDRRTSLGGHLSLSASNLATPLAESTQLNGTGLQTKFPWGGKMSPAPSAASTSKSNSSSFLQKSVSKVAVSPIRRIDPRIYTDVQSKGLASRIVKYHENSSRLNRSASVGNLYSKPGQFPVVHLKKTEVHVKPRHNSGISVVRIAPPEQPLYQTSTRSSIFRTGLIGPAIGLSNQVEKESHDNRPILPPAENDVNPTRSVLDALKEISRKRINSDDVDCNDSIKKYCKESDDDPRRRLNLPLHHPNNLTSQQVSVITKRQRELPTPADPKTLSPDSAVTKKRLCTKNNDITSSLSSSLLLNTPKRKLQDVHGRPPIGRGSPPSAPSVSVVPQPQAKQQCNDRNFVLSSEQILERTSSYPPQQLLTPIPPTPAIEFPLNRPQMRGELPKPLQTAAKPKLTLFNVDYDTAPQVARKVEEEVNTAEEEGIAGISFIKPKKNSPILTGRNALIERVQTSKLSLMLSCLSGELNDDSDDDVDGGVKEKTKEIEEAPVAPSAVSSASLTMTNSLPQTTLSSSGGLTFNAPSTSVPSSTSAATTFTSTTSTATDGGFSFGLKTTTATTAATSTPTTTVSDTAKTPDAAAPKPTFSFGNTSSSKPSETTSITTSSTSALGTSRPCTGFGFTAAPASQVASDKPATTGGFTLGLQKPTDSIVPSTTTAAPSAGGSLNKSFSFGGATSSQTSDASRPMASLSSGFAAIAPTTTVFSLSFNNPAPAFGAPAATPSQPPAFSFGAAKSSPATTASATPSLIPAPTFGSSATVSKPPPMFGSSVTSATANAPSNAPAVPVFGNPQQSAPTFAFGASAFTSAAGATNKPPPPAFGDSVGNTFGNPTPSGHSAGFNFGGSSATSNGGVFGSAASNAPATTTSTGMFGSGAASTTTASSTGIFGSATMTTTANTSFSFGSTTVSKPAFNFNPSANTSVASAFGSSAQPAVSSQPAFAFGSSTGAPVSQPATTTQSTPFSFGGASAPQSTQAPSTAFNFGGSAHPAQPSNNTPSFAFGSTQSSNMQPAAPTKSFSFGGTAPISAFTAVNNNKPATGGFAFNASAAAPTSETKNIFGSTSASPAPSFSFSGTPTKKDEKAPAPVFGSPASTNSASAPAFGAPPMTPGKLFSFGSTAANNNASSNAAPSTNLFGSSSANTGTTSLFPAAAHANSPAFGSNTNASKPAAPVFSFGGSAASTTSNNNNNNNNSTAASPFQFGSSAPAAEASKTFGFGAGSSQAPAGNIFGNSATANAASFNFSGGGQNTMNNNALAAPPNPFSPAGTDGTLRREIRTATRRLKK